MRTIAETDWAYLAGLVDGEGCISANSQHAPRYHAQLKVVNTKREMLDWIARTFEVGKVSLNRKATGKSKDCFKWRVTGSVNVSFILVSLLPYLTIKRDQAVLAIELSNRPSVQRQGEIYNHLKELKK